MIVKYRLGDLRSIIAEVLVIEGVGDGEGNDSLDAQIDRYLSQYERSAKDGGLDEADAENDAEEDAPKVPAGDLDVEAFANDVVRLIENYDSLLEVRNTVVRRAVAFLDDIYENDVSRKFLDVMKDDHGIVPGKSKIDHEAEEFSAPPGDRAGSSLNAGP